MNITTFATDRIELYINNTQYYYGVTRDLVRNNREEGVDVIAELIQEFIMEEVPENYSENPFMSMAADLVAYVNWVAIAQNIMNEE